MDWHDVESISKRSSQDGHARLLLVGVAIVLVMVAVLAGRSFVETATATVNSSSDTNIDTVENQQDSELKRVIVHVSGAVANPGVYDLEEGSRIVDVVQAAGGFTDDAAESSVNLARQIADGEHIVVLRTNELEGSEANAGQSNEVPKNPVSINDASAAKLTELPGIGDALAERIVAYRTKNGPFRKLGDLMLVPGIGQAKFDALSDLICL